MKDYSSSRSGFARDISQNYQTQSGNFGESTELVERILDIALNNGRSYAKRMNLIEKELEKELTAVGSRLEGKAAQYVSETIDKLGDHLAGRKSVKNYDVVSARAKALAQEWNYTTNPRVGQRSQGGLVTRVAATPEPPPQGLIGRDDDDEYDETGPGLLEVEVVDRDVIDGVATPVIEAPRGGFGRFVVGGLAGVAIGLASMYGIMTARSNNIVEDINRDHAREVAALKRDYEEKTAANHDLEMQNIILKGTQTELVGLTNDLQEVVQSYGITEPQTELVMATAPLSFEPYVAKIIEAGQEFRAEANREAARQENNQKLLSIIGFSGLWNTQATQESRIPTGLTHDADGRLSPVYDAPQLMVRGSTPMPEEQDYVSGVSMPIIGAPIDVDNFDIPSVKPLDLEHASSFSTFDEAEYIDRIVATTQIQNLPTLSKPILYGTLDLQNKKIIEVKELEPMLGDTFIDTRQELLAVADGFSKIAPMSSPFTRNAFNVHAKQLGIPESFVQELEGDSTKTSSLDNLIAFGNYAGLVRADKDNDLPKEFFPIGKKDDKIVKFVGGSQ